MSPNMDSLDTIRDRLNGADKAPAIVFSGHITGLAVVRSLGRRGVPSLVLDRDPNGVAFASRYTTASGDVPNPQRDEAGFIDRLLEIGEVLDRRGVLFPTNDDWLLAVLRHRERLSKYYDIPVSDLETVERILDKTRLYDEVRRLGIQVPESHVLTDDRYEEVRDAIRYPVIVKPAHQRPFYDAFGVKVFEAGSREELDTIWKRTRPHSVLVQEVIPPEAATFVSLGSYVDRTGRLRGAFVGRKREQYPGGFGTACLVDGDDSDEVVESGARLLSTLGFQGVSELEYILDARDGRYKVIDLNTRVWKWIGLPVAAGVDLPWLAYADATEEPSVTTETARALSPLRWVHVQDYLKSRASAPGGTEDHLSDAQWATLLGTRNGETPSIVDAVVDPDDPGPGVRQIRDLFRPEPYYCPC